jgi:hypothetical protein
MMGLPSEESFKLTSATLLDSKDDDVDKRAIRS